MSSGKGHFPCDGRDGGTDEFTTAIPGRSRKERPHDQESGTIADRRNCSLKANLSRVQAFPSCKPKMKPCQGVDREIGLGNVADNGVGSLNSI